MAFDMLGGVIQLNRYILCFRDFQFFQYKRNPCVFVELNTNLHISESEIHQKFSHVEYNNKFLRQFGIIDGMWGLVSVANMNSVLRINYDENI